MSAYATQAERVLRHLEEHGEISAADTLRWSPPITRLAARIADLKAAGHPVDAIGKAGKFAKYGLVSPLRDGAKREVPVLCPRCGKPMSRVTPTISPGLVIGRCPTHGDQAVKR